MGNGSSSPPYIACNAKYFFTFLIGLPEIDLISFDFCWTSGCFTVSLRLNNFAKKPCFSSFFFSSTGGAFLASANLA